jgi:hypothetical protein
MAFARPKFQVMSHASTGLLSPSAAFRSTGKTYDYQNPRKNKAPVELAGKMIKWNQAKYKAPTWNSLLESSHDFKSETPKSSRRKVVSTARTVHPELQDAPRARANSKYEQTTRNVETTHGITNCERKHSKQGYTHNFQLSYANEKRTIGKSNHPIVNDTSKNVDEIGIPAATKIKDSAKYPKYRS